MNFVGFSGLAGFNTTVVELKEVFCDEIHLALSLKSFIITLINMTKFLYLEIFKTYSIS